MPTAASLRTNAPLITPIVIDFEKERGRIVAQSKVSCPSCKEIGVACPDWVSNVWPTDKEFMDLSVDDMIEWLDHTTHLI